MEWIDTHAHLYAEDFNGNIGELLQRAREASVSRIISVGVNGRTNPQCIRFAEEHEEIFAAVGWQPTDLDELGDEMELSPVRLRELHEQACHPKVVAIGEIGLDYFRLPRTQTDEVLRVKERQKRIFRQHLELAAELGLPCAIHQRGDGTLEDCLEIMRSLAGRIRAVFHCFVGDLKAAQAFFDLGCLVSLTGIVTFKKAEELRETIRSLPPEKIMIETDCPYLAPEPHFRKLCEPSYVVHTGKRIAGILGLSPEDFSQIASRTTRNFFPKMK